MSGRLLGQSAPTDTSFHDAYTVPTGGPKIRVAGVNIANITGTDTTATVSIAPGGAAAANSQIIAQVTAKAGVQTPIIIQANLNPGDVIRVKSATASALTFTVQEAG